MKTKSTKNIGESTKRIGGSAFAQLFASEPLVALLKQFLLNPDQTFYQAQLAELCSSRLYLIQRDLKRLEKAGVITKTRRGNRAYYQANRAFPAFEDLKRVFLKTVALGDALKGALTSFAGRVQLAFIYGSYASGHETAESDIDLLMVGRLSAREAAAVFGPLKREIGREFNPVIYSPEEFRLKVKEAHHFLKAVLKGRKVFLIGDEHEIERIAG